MRIDDLTSYRLNQDFGNQLRDHVYSRSQEAFDKGNSERDRIQDAEQLSARQTFIREKFLESLGGLPSSETPLNPRVMGTVQGDGFKIEKVIFESRPHHYVTANLYVPDGIEIPSAAVLFLCGHFDQGKHAPDYQTVCQYLAGAGLIVLAMDPIGQGERQSYYEPELGKSLIDQPISDHDYVGVQCLLLDNPLAKYFLHDAMRAIDYLLTRPEVDSARIGVNGNSGGGLQTSMLMLADPRIAAAAPATFIMSRGTYILSGQAQDAEQIWPGFSAFGLDHEDILIAVVPKPVLLLAVSSDFFPIEGTEQTYARVRRFWEMYDAADRIQLFIDNSVHKYTVPMAKEAARFFSKHLLHAASTELKDSISLFAPELLWCTNTGKVIGELDQAKTIHDINIEMMEKIEKTLALDALSKQAGIEWLRQQVHGPRKKVSLNPRIPFSRELYNLNMQSVFWRSQQDLFNHGFEFRDRHNFNPAQTPTIALWEGGTTRCAEHFSWIQDRCSRGGAVLVLDVTGTGSLAPNPISPQPIENQYGTVHKLTTDLIWLNDSLTALRVYDILRAVDLMSLLGIETESVEVYTVGRVDLYPRLASLLDNRITKIEGYEGVGSLKQLVKLKYYNDYGIYNFVLPGLLRYMDV